MNMDERSPYAPPLSDIEVIDNRKGSPWKAVLLGLLVDHVGTFIFIIIFGVIANALFIGEDGDTSRLMSLLDEPLSPLMLFFYTTGCLFSVLGGFVCARIARQNELKLAFVLAALSLLYGVIIDDEAAVSALDLLLYSAGVASIFLGSWLGMKRNRRRRNTA